VAAAAFELDPAASSVIFGDGERTVGWADLPRLETGFVTAEARGLGGLGRPASVEPGVLGAAAFELPAPAGTTSVAIRVAGWLGAGLPDDDELGRFEALTADAPIPR
jgi:hypothetical protein